MPIEQLAMAYVVTINGPANGLGQHVHPTLGRSDSIMLRMQREFGQEATHAALDAAMRIATRPEPAP